MSAMLETATFFMALLAVATTTQYSEASPPPSLAQEIHPLRPQSGSSGHHVHGLSCTSWRLAVEVHNLVGWETVPLECEGYIGHYMLGHQYRLDSRFVVDAAIAYAKNVSLKGDGKDIWVFDIDETVLSNLPYYAEIGFGVKPYNSTSYGEWEAKGICPALPESLRLYKKLLSLGIKVVFITGKTEDKRKIATSNLIRAGYYKWEKLILKPSAYSGKTAVVYKSSERKELEGNGYRIVGNIGDQWSDILGAPEGLRTFKLPDPMYYIS